MGRRVGKHRWIRHGAGGIVVGLLVTLAIAVGQFAGLWAPLDRAYLDFCFKYAGSVEADPRILMIDINDVALCRIERWPWPRRMQADLVDVLSECGAQAILLDLIYTEPQVPRVVLPQLSPDARFLPGIATHGTVGTEDAIYDDIEFSQAIEKAGDVYLGMYFSFSSPADDSPRRLTAISEQGEDTSDSSLDDGLVFTSSDGEGENDRRELTAKAVQLLIEDFSMNAKRIAQKLAADLSAVEREIGSAKEFAARRVANEFLAAHPESSFEELFRQVLPGASLEASSRDRQDLIRGYRQARASSYVYKDSPFRIGDFDRYIPRATNPLMPIEEVARAARSVGFVSFRTDDDGVLRHIPVLVNVDNHVVMQLAFSLACDVLDIDTDGMRVAKDRTLQFSNKLGDRHWSIPLTPDGQMLINWHTGASEWHSSFSHIPVSRVMEVAFNRRTVSANEAIIPLLKAEAVELLFDEAESAYLDYERMVRRLQQAPKDVDDNELVSIRAEVEKTENLAIAQLAKLSEEIEGLTPEDEYERSLFSRVRFLHDRLCNDRYAKKIAQDNDALIVRNGQLLAELRQKIGGKLCFVGHTAAAQADMVNSPAYNDLPGVMAHANLANTLLLDRVPTRASGLTNAAILVLCGLAVTLVTSICSPWTAIRSMVLIMGCVLGASALLMHEVDFYLSSAEAAIAAFVVWALVTLYRQITEERRKRSFARELSRNTSPAIAAVIAEQVDDLDLSPQPAEVTCYFSDLQGFTTISERLGAEQTQSILNRYLGAMSDVLIAHQAFNKFMGDGIFAFFNAPILPVRNHAREGCLAAIETARRLGQLRKQANATEADEFAGLRMRVGLHSGPAFVGYFGSDNQTDYTCIGDTVNLAARLEPANKVFGTQTLVSGQCREQAGGGFEYRYLGLVQVKGKVLAVPVYELLGVTEEVDRMLLEYAELFSAAVEQFQQREWGEARERFERCHQIRPDDDACLLYLAETDRLASCPPDDEWTKSIALTSK